ncbi:MAG: hypothetical protein NVS2B16_17260 [Chloroflexota bacterium]
MKTHAYRLWVTGVIVLTLALSILLPAAVPASAAGTVQLSRAVVAPSDTVTVTGAGFAAGATVVVSVELRVQGTARGVQTSTRANTGGAFTVPLPIPDGTNRGVYTVRARDFHANSATQNLTVRPRIILQIGKTAALTVAVGHGFFALGAGYAPGETVAFTAVFPLYNGNSVTETKIGTSDKNGTVAELFLAIPRRAKQGSVLLTATGEKSGKKAIATITVTHYPILSLNPTTVRPGGATTVSGAGFVPDSTVRIALTIPRTGTTTVTLTKAVATNADGAFATPISLPSNVQPGTYVITATGDVGSFRAQRPVIVAVSPSISLQPGSAFPGQTITVVGANFSSNVQVLVSASFPVTGGASLPVSRTAQTNGAGSFSTALPVPAGALVAKVTVVAKGPHAQAGSTLNVVRLAASLSIQPNPASPGQTVTISGAGLSAGVSVTLTAVIPLFGGGTRTVSATVGTNGQGQYTAQLRIPRHAASGPITVTARSAHGQRSVQLQVGHIPSRITISPASTVPGGSVTISGSGYNAGARIDINVTVRTHSGAAQALPLTATTNGNGQFSVVLQLPATVAGGVYTVAAKSAASGRVRTAQITVAKLVPSIVAVPTTGAPGTPLTINGFGFEPGATVALSIHGQRVSATTANGNGQFSTRAIIPHGLASGTYHIMAVSNSGRTASNPLVVNRNVATHFYFASFYTGSGYHEYLALLNPTAINARVTIGYLLGNGAPHTKTITVSAHSRATEDVNADLGPHVSAGAVVAADVPIVAERLVYHGSDGAVVPGALAPSTTWYFANGNTSHGYREYLAIENPNTGGVRVGITFFPAHSRAFTIDRTMAPTSRTTVKVKSFVPRDAVGVRVTSNGPIVVNRTIFNRHGMTSKIGVRSPHRTWYFAAGPRDGRARNWIAVTNPLNRRSYVTLRTYGPFGRELGVARGWLRPHARAGYLINRIAHQPDVSVVLTASTQVVAEQTTYVGRMADASTDTFGVPAARTWSFAAVNTLTSGGQADVLNLFNPNLVPVPIVVQFMSGTGSVAQRTYVVGPLNHQRVDVGSVEPNAQLGIVAASSDPFIALNQGFFNNHLGSVTSTGIHV